MAGRSRRRRFLHPGDHRVAGAVQVLQFAQDLHQLPMPHLQAAVRRVSGFVIGHGQPQGDAAEGDFSEPANPLSHLDGLLGRQCVQLRRSFGQQHDHGGTHVEACHLGEPVERDVLAGERFAPD